MATLALADSSLQRWWRLRSATERSVILAAGLIVSVAVAWIAVWQPLQRDTVRLQRQVTAQRAALAEAQRQAGEIASLARASVPEPSGDLRADVNAALSKQQPRLVPAAIEPVERAGLRVTFESLSFESLVALLDTLQRDVRVRATDLSTTARVEPGQVRAEITLRR